MTSAWAIRRFSTIPATAAPAIVGIVEVIREGYPDATAFDPVSPYYDPASTPANPRWHRVDVRLVRHLRAG